MLLHPPRSMISSISLIGSFSSYQMSQSSVIQGLANQFERANSDQFGPTPNRASLPIVKLEDELLDLPTPSVDEFEDIGSQMADEISKQFDLVAPVITQVATDDRKDFEDVGEQVADAIFNQFELEDPKDPSFIDFGEEVLNEVSSRFDEVVPDVFDTLNLAPVVVKPLIDDLDDVGGLLFDDIRKTVIAVAPIIGKDIERIGEAIGEEVSKDIERSFELANKIEEDAFKLAGDIEGDAFTFGETALIIGGGLLAMVLAFPLLNPTATTQIVKSQSEALTSIAPLLLI